MSKVLCITSGLTGILNASLELMRRLELMGYEVVAASPRDCRRTIERYGFSYHQLEMINFFPTPETPSFSGPLKRLRGLKHRIVNYKSRRDEGVRLLGMHRFHGDLVKIRPDLIIIDVELHEHIMTAYAHGFNLILLSQWFSIWNLRGLPPIQSHTVPGEGIWGTPIGLRLSWELVRMRRWKIFFWKKITTWYTDRRSILQYYAKKVGFPQAYIAENYWPGPFVYDTLPVMSMTARELEFPHQERPNHYYVGPMVFEDRKDRFRSDATENLTRTLEKAGDRKIIYCSLSTFQKGDISFLKKVIDAVQEQDQWILIVTGSKLINLDLNALPKNVFVYDWVNQLQVLSKASCSINHGGIHTINECLYFGVPILIYSGKKSDQNGCAARVHYHELGIRADKDEDTYLDVRSKIREVLSNETIRSNAKRMKHLIREKGYQLLTDVMKKNSL